MVTADVKEIDAEVRLLMLGFEPKFKARTEVEVEFLTN